MSKFITTVFLIFLIFLLASCAPAATQAEASLPPSGSPAQAASPSPVETPDPAVSAPPTGPEESTPAAKPEPDASPSPSIVPAGIVKDSGVIIGTGVVFRAAPKSDSKVIARLNYGTYVQILKTNIDAQWHQVKYDGKTGYINRMYICLDSSLDGYKLDYVATIVNCKNDVNVRSEPSADSKIVGVADKGAKLTILPQDAHTDGWYQVDFNGKTGYIHADYLDIEAKADDTQLTNLSISGGSLYPSFLPKEYGYVIKTSASPGHH